MKNIFASLLALSLLVSASVASAKTGPITGPQAKAQISARLQYSSKVPDRTRPFTTRLGGQKGDRVRPFTASNVRTVSIPGSAPAGAQGGAILHTGNTVTGKLNMQTGAVRTTGVSMVR